MSPRHLSSDKWSELPPADPSREIRFIAQTARQLGFTRPGVESALLRGALEGCRVAEPDGTVRVAVYQDSIEAFVPQRHPASQRTCAEDAVDESMPSATLRASPHAADSIGPLSTGATAAILRLVEAIETYESATRHSDVARRQITSALDELDQVAERRAAAVEVLRNLASSMPMPETVADLLDRADRPIAD